MPTPNNQEQSRVYDYESYFNPELELLNDQFNQNEQLYNEVHKGMELNLERMGQKSMYGGSSPYRDVAELGKVLNDIRSNQVQVIKERTNIKKTIKDLEMRRDNSNKGDKNNMDAQGLMRDFLTELQRQKPDYNKPQVHEITNNSGIEKLADLDPVKLGVNENDLKMIDRFKGKIDSRK